MTLKINTALFLVIALASCHLNEEQRTIRNFFGQANPLTLAISQGDLNKVQVITSELDMNSPERGKPYVAFAIKRKKIEIAKILIKRGFNTFYETTHPELCPRKKCLAYEPLPYAVKEKLGPKVVDQLLEVNDIDTGVGRLSQTSLHIVAQNCDSSMASYLLSRKASVDVFDYQGRSPLHYAAINDCLPIVHLLVSNRAITEKLDIYKRRAIDYSRNKDIRWMISHQN